jgi:flavin reductase (DIM6/NTAB) family NADH-FMN oxidoreductase RutF
MRKIIPDQIETKDLHQFMVGAIAPRPIAFVSTIDENGVANVAPYSFFNAFSSNPPVLVFSSNRRVADNTTKDTLHNVEKNQEVVINVVDYAMVRQMAIASISYPTEVSEFDKSGLTPLESETVAPYRVGESPVQFECRVTDIIKLGDHGGAGHLIICKVLCIHIDEEVIDDRNRLDPHKLDLVGRLGRAHYVRASGDAIFDVYQSPSQIALGFDKLPEHILESNIFTGNDLAQFAGQLDYPAQEEVEELMELDSSVQNILQVYDQPSEQLQDALHKAAQLVLAKGKIEQAFKIAMVYELV